MYCEYRNNLSSETTGSKISRRNLATLGWQWGKTRYIVIGYLIPLCYAVVIYGFVWLTGLAGVYRKDFVGQVARSFGLGAMPERATIALYFVFTATFAIIPSCATALGEEIGWRAAVHRIRVDLGYG